MEGHLDARLHLPQPSPATIQNPPTTVPCQPPVCTHLFVQPSQAKTLVLWTSQSLVAHLPMSLQIRQKAGRSLQPMPRRSMSELPRLLRLRTRSGSLRRRRPTCQGRVRKKESRRHSHAPILSKGLVHLNFLSVALTHPAFPRSQVLSSPQLSSSVPALS